MNIIVNQFFGIGDVIFCMTIARRWQAEGHSVIWPVLPHFVEGLRRAYPDIHFTDKNLVNIDYERKDEHDWNGHRVVPLRWNVEILGVPYDHCMSSKYSLFNMDYKEWKEKATFHRDEKRELNVASMSYVYPLDEPYVLVNEMYGSEMTHAVKIGDKLPDNPVHIYLENYTRFGYSLFDWGYVLENAAEIHTVSTSLIYLLELMDIKCPIHLYPRPTDPYFSQVSYLFTKPYILHG